MTEELKSGDRVRVTFEGDVADITDKETNLVRVQFGPERENWVYIYGQHCERILPPLAVGEPVPVERLGELPEGSWLEPFGNAVTPLVLRDGNWRWLCLDARQNFDPDGIGAQHLPAHCKRQNVEPILLRLGDGTS